MFCYLHRIVHTERAKEVLIILIALILLPLAEIAAFVEVGGLIGTGPTLLLAALFTLLGIFIVRQQGFQTLRRTQAALERGETPVTGMLDGGLLVIAGLLMIVPGLLTDAAGLLLLVPAIRRGLGRLLVRRTFMRMEAGPHPGAPGGRRADGPGPVIEAEAWVVEEEEAVKEKDGTPPGHPSSPWNRTGNRTEKS